MQQQQARSKLVIGLAFFTALTAARAHAFEGHVSATLARGGETQTFLYTVGTNTLRIERGESDRPYAKNIVNRDTGEITLVFPHNRSFVRLKSSGANTAAPAPVMPGLPPGGMPPGLGPQTGTTPPGAGGMPAPPAGLPPGIGPQAQTPAASAFPAMPMMPPPEMDKLELKATGEKTNLLGYACARYEIKQRGEVMEIWATDQLLPYQPWLQNQPPRFGPQMIEEKWGELVKAKKLFPLLATLKSENGVERLRFEVKSITPQRIEDRGGALFQPPPDYQEIQPLPF
jgi:Domain of unknown function (DUF4412)